MGLKLTCFSISLPILPPPPCSTCYLFIIFIFYSLQHKGRKYLLEYVLGTKDTDLNRAGNQTLLPRTFVAIWSWHIFTRKCNKLRLKNVTLQWSYLLGVKQRLKHWCWTSGLEKQKDLEEDNHSGDSRVHGLGIGQYVRSEITTVGLHCAFWSLLAIKDCLTIE